MLQKTILESLSYLCVKKQKKVITEIKEFIEADEKRAHWAFEPMENNKLLLNGEVEVHPAFAARDPQVIKTALSRTEFWAGRDLDNRDIKKLKVDALRAGDVAAKQLTSLGINPPSFTPSSASRLMRMIGALNAKQLDNTDAPILTLSLVSDLMKELQLNDGLAWIHGYELVRQFAREQIDGWQHSKVEKAEVDQKVESLYNDPHRSRIVNEWASMVQEFPASHFGDSITAFAHSRKHMQKAATAMGRHAADFSDYHKIIDSYFDDAPPKDSGNSRQEDDLRSAGGNGFHGNSVLETVC